MALLHEVGKHLLAGIQADEGEGRLEEQDGERSHKCALNDVVFFYINKAQVCIEEGFVCI